MTIDQSLADICGSNRNFVSMHNLRAQYHRRVLQAKSKVGTVDAANVSDNRTQYGSMVLLSSTELVLLTNSLRIPTEQSIRSHIR